MRRDLDLVRSILIYVEKAEDEVDAEDLVTDGWPFETVFWSSDILTGSQTRSAREPATTTFWNSDILTGSQTSELASRRVELFWSSDILTGSQT